MGLAIKKPLILRWYRLGASLSGLGIFVLPAFREGLERRCGVKNASFLGVGKLANLGGDWSGVKVFSSFRAVGLGTGYTLGCFRLLGRIAKLRRSCRKSSNFGR